MSGERSSHFFEVMMEKYDCSNNHWLCNLNSMHEKWCPAFSKQYFSGGVLSSQRSETMNRSLKRRLRATADLCNFYNIFCDVVSEWRSKENGEDYRCSKGNIEMAFPSINILKHAMSVYIVEVFLMFEKEFIDGAAYNYKAIESSSSAMSFEVWGIRITRESYGEEPYEFQHVITFNKDNGVVDYSCKMFTECKGIKDGQNLELGSSTGKEYVGCSSIWKMQMLRKINSIITVSQMNKNVRTHCEKYFMELKELIEFNVGSIHWDEDEQAKVLNSLPNVLNPPCSRQKGVRNKRFKSVVEKKCDQVKWKKSKKLSKNDITLSTFNHSSLIPHVQDRVGEGSFPALSFHPTYHFYSTNSSSVFIPVTAPPVLQQFHIDIFSANASRNDKH
ncbi:hypothetical protein Cgig2_012018 [Carnegiea gigantea]|uniref:Protein FAR1-RELATED SEQUENCE n=1 Tax=Carnegiea gigantea TaxID=171969 RepID=A0A9Q1QM93_9CARY|nr:hypothetical protein Cgig2_012018 [Carnegiea gigantea]